MFPCRLDENAQLMLLQPRHATELFACIQANYKRIRQFMTWLPDTFTLDDTKKRINESLERFAAGNGFEAGIWVDGALVGCARIHSVDQRHKSANIGYWLDAGFEGRGLVTKSCRVLMACGFDDLYLNRIEMRCMTPNRKSRSVIDRLGLTYEGLLRQRRWHHGQFADLYVFSMLAHEWRARQQATRPRSSIACSSLIDAGIQSSIA